MEPYSSLVNDCKREAEAIRRLEELYNQLVTAVAVPPSAGLFLDQSQVLRG
jgi:hypothetical protein